jgi:hypothetical protein
MIATELAEKLSLFWLELQQLESLGPLTNASLEECAGEVFGDNMSYNFLHKKVSNNRRRLTE